MFVFRVRASHIKNIIPAAVIAAVIAAAVCAACALGAVQQPRDSVGGVSLSVEDGAAGFLARLGLEADAEHTEKKSVTLPGEFGEVYEAYNEMQKQAGLDLLPYRGEEASLWTVPLRAQSPQGARYAVLLVLKNRVIGGHLTSGEYGAELFPLMKIGEENGTTG